MCACRRVILAQYRDEFILQQRLARKSFTLLGEGANRQIQHIPIEQVGDVECTAWPKFEHQLWSNFGDVCDQWRDQNNSCKIIDRNSEASRRRERIELVRLK